MGGRSGVPKKNRFDSINDAAVCPKAKVLKGELRPGITMSGVFCTERIEAGEFICAWNGVQMVWEGDDHLGAINNQINTYDLSKYGIETKYGSNTYYTCVRLDKEGLPTHPESQSPDKSDISMAAFMNEANPALRAVAVPNRPGNYNSEVTIRIEQDRSNRNSANACLKLHKQKDIVCPLLFARRDIAPGSEITWSYGELYDRRAYKVDYPENVFEVHENSEYSTLYVDSMCKITCESVLFASGYTSSHTARDVVLGKMNRIFFSGEKEDEEVVRWRSNKYLESIPEEEGEEEEEEEGEPSQRKRTQPQKTARSTKRRKLRRRKVFEEVDTVNLRRQNFIAWTKKVSGAASNAQTTLSDLKETKKNEGKADMIRILKQVFDFVYPKVELSNTFAAKQAFQLNQSRFGDFASVRETSFELQYPNYQFLCTMQTKFFNDLTKASNSIRVIRPLQKLLELFVVTFDPNVYTAEFDETIEDWLDIEFQKTHPVTRNRGVDFLKAVADIATRVVYPRLREIIWNLTPATRNSNILNTVNQMIVAADEKTRLHFQLLWKMSTVEKQCAMLQRGWPAQERAEALLCTCSSRNYFMSPQSNTGS